MNYMRKNNTSQHGLKFVPENIYKNKFCIGCGVCKYQIDDNVKFAINEEGQYLPSISKKISSQQSDKFHQNIKTLCPFSDCTQNEDVLAKEKFKSMNKDHRIGYYHETYAGYSNSRDDSSSGGAVYEFTSYLLRSKTVDAVLHVKPKKNSSTKFDYFFSEDLESLSEGKGSHYYPISIGNKINKIKQYKSVAVVGLPCFITAISQLCKVDKEINQIIKYKIGLVCGHLKTSHFSNYISMQIIGKNLSKSDNIKFRAEHKGMTKANEYAMSVDTPSRSYTKSIRKLFGVDWGFGLFKLKGCDFCDDVFAETADIVFGDAWLDKYLGDYKGTNIIISRKIEISSILKILKNDKRLFLEHLTLDDIASSQHAGLRHRKFGIFYREKFLNDQGSWTPIKRDNPYFQWNDDDNKKYITRYKLSQYSASNYLTVKNKSQYNLFLIQLLNNMSDYFLIYKPDKYFYIPNKIFCLIKKIYLFIKHL